VEKFQVVVEMLFGESSGVASDVIFEFFGVFVFPSKESCTERRECDNLDSEFLCCRN